MQTQDNVFGDYVQFWTCYRAVLSRYITTCSITSYHTTPYAMSCEAAISVCCLLVYNVVLILYVVVVVVVVVGREVVCS